MIKKIPAAADIDVLTTSIPLAHFGHVAINAFVLHGREPVLVDTGMVQQRDLFMSALRDVIDPAELRWIWLTHTDFDHIGALQTLLDENPKIRVITSFLGVGIMSLAAPLPMDRVYLVTPGDKVALADRTLTAFRPPAFDNPCTLGFYDDKSRALFSSDAFGACLPSPPERAEDLAEEELRAGQVFWASVDSPWLHKVDQGLLAKELDVVRRMEPELVLSSHLAPASGRMVDRLLSALASVPSAPPFVGPNQAALEAMMQAAAA